MSLAAIDCGTNSTRLLIVSSEGTRLVHELRTTRLGQGVDSQRRLSDAGIQRTLDALREFRTLINEYDVVAVRAVATSAARDADNRPELFVPAAEILDAELELLSGEEEGQLTYAGATADLDSSSNLVLDIGGGSTELTLGDGGGIVGTQSMDVGCVRLTERFMQGNPPRPEELADALAVVDEWLTDVAAVLPVAEIHPALIGVAGTVTTVAAIDLGLTGYRSDAIHGHIVTRSAIEQMFRSMSGQTIAQLREDQSIPPERADVIVAGVVILLATMRHFGFEHCRVSDHDILHGLIQTLHRQ